jgi:hypothetical protein
MKSFNYKKFFITLILTGLVLLAFDIIKDYFTHELDWKEIFGIKNILLKLACGTILGIYLATMKKEDES